MHYWVESSAHCNCWIPSKGQHNRILNISLLLAWNSFWISSWVTSHWRYAPMMSPWIKPGRYESNWSEWNCPWKQQVGYLRPNSLDELYLYRRENPHGLPLILPWISNHMSYKVCDEITYPFPNYNCAIVEVWECISKFIAHFTGHMTMCAWWD